MTTAHQQSIFGFFDGPGDKPTFDPGLEVMCPYCLRPLSMRARRTHSIAIHGDYRSFFYRTHASCDEVATDKQREQIESSLIDTRAS